MGNILCFTNVIRHQLFWNEMSKISNECKLFLAIHSRSVLTLWVTRLLYLICLAAGGVMILGDEAEPPGRFLEVGEAVAITDLRIWHAGHNKQRNLEDVFFMASTLWTWHFLRLQTDKVNLDSKGGGREAAQGWRASRADQGCTHNSGVAKTCQGSRPIFKLTL